MQKRELLSLIGILTHASKAFRPGCAYVRRLIDLFTTAKCLDHYSWINTEARADMEWWHCLLGSWNGTAMMFSNLPHTPNVI